MEPALPREGLEDRLRVDKCIKPAAPRGNEDSVLVIIAEARLSKVLSFPQPIRGADLEKPLSRKQPEGSRLPIPPPKRSMIEILTKSSLLNASSKKFTPDYQSLDNFASQRHHQKWDDPSSRDHDIGIEPPSPNVVDLPSEPSSSIPCNPNDQIKITDQLGGQMKEVFVEATRLHDWEPRAMLTNLSFLEQKIHQLQDLVHLIVGRESRVLGQPDKLMAQQQQQLVTADLTSIIVQLISTAGSLLPSVKHNISAANPFASQSGQLGSTSGVISLERSNGESKVSDHSDQIELMGNCVLEQNYADQPNQCASTIKENDSKDDEDGGERENLPPGSYEVLQLEKEEILAPHTHFCEICGKGFKRDANLRMHMRGHGDKYKTPAALAKPTKESGLESMLIKRYSCPYAGCKRNKDHKKFHPLKTILCVKNHYKRTHCDKSYICSRCNTKKFSVIADLKTHEKHCGRDKWLCSCGTTFSRKDKLFGHVTLFQGHSPVLPLHETKGLSGPSDHGVGSTGFNFSSVTFSESGLQNDVDIKDNADDPTGCFSPLNFEACNFGGFNEFPRPPFEVPESSFSFLSPGSRNYNQKTGEATSSDDF
ncbi:hypothetical protein HHK36_007877 [Tetracentron sinense]|uniref:C2H2-type domain-containing protein n=1 Tax=Tetracentron sinense TaxID=13715 RepID=A0A834ZEL1_TETSI|nr:hypothetical protein HHK36_007877 [Tetracentron sinense]